MGVFRLVGMYRRRETILLEEMGDSPPWGGIGGRSGDSGAARHGVSEICSYDSVEFGIFRPVAICTRLESILFAQMGDSAT